MNAARLFEAVNRADIRMIERRQHLRFTPEAREPVRIAGQSRGKDLDGNLAIQLRVASKIDLAHPAATECAEDLEVPSEDATGDELRLAKAALIQQCIALRIGLKHALHCRNQKWIPSTGLFHEACAPVFGLLYGRLKYLTHAPEIFRRQSAGRALILHRCYLP